MSRLTDLLHKARQTDPALAADLEREIKHLTERRAFGLNFERHTPETVELPGRKVRRGDKVRVLPPRGEARTADSDILWRVVAISRDGDTRTAELIRLDGEEGSAADVDDVVVVAEFRDPIYPGLVSTGKVERGGDKPFHTVINAENYHALQALLFTHRGRIDAIYIDPPYNTGAKDWKYNNDYVDAEDHYRHSKWLAFMERRLERARELLNPDASALVVTIDEKEVHRLALLLQQVFPGCRVQMISSVINPTGAIRVNEFTRTNEYILVALIGESSIVPDSVALEEGESVRWNSLRRFENSSRRGSRPAQFYAVYVNEESHRIIGVSDALSGDVNRHSVEPPKGCVAVFPLKPDGTEMIWGLTGPALLSRVASGYARATPNRRGGYSLYYLTSGKIDDIAQGEIAVVGRSLDGSAVVERPLGVKTTMPLSQWDRPSHNAQAFGTKLLARMLPDGRRFPFPKSLYAVEDAMRYFVKDKPSAVVLDFFSGSGTTAHAIMRLNKQDGGRRQCISITNNEVSADEQKDLRRQRLRPGDSCWEKLGICDHVTKPRITAAITGLTPSGDPIKGDYKFIDEFPVSEGFEENAEFFTLTYESPGRVARHRDFGRIAPLLWMAAGSGGRRIEDVPDGWDVADTYGVLVDLDLSGEFVQAVASADELTHAFIVTDDERSYQVIADALPDRVESVRLYETYLKNFEIQTARSAQ